jgi:hypothetical protein
MLLQVDEDLVRKQQAAYSVAGVDEEVSELTAALDTTHAHLLLPRIAMP